MTTDELLEKLPAMIGNKRTYDSEGRPDGYIMDSTGTIGFLHLCNDGMDCVASYGEEGDYVCLNSTSKNPPYNYVSCCTYMCNI